MKRLATAITLFLLMFSTTFGAVKLPEQTILGAEGQIDLGELVELKLSPIQFVPKDMVSTDATWRVIDMSDGGKEKKVKSDKESVYFGAGVQPKRLIVFCFVTYLFVEKNGDKISSVYTEGVVIRTDLVIGGGGPTPTPTPTPTPNPSVVIPDGQFKVGPAIYGLSMKVPVASRQKGATALAKAFRGTAATIAAGVFKDSKNPLEDILVKATASNRSALGEVQVPTQDWLPVITEFGDMLFDLYKSGKARTADDYKTIFNEVATGLEAVK